jgi:hypothetical protein
MSVSAILSLPQNFGSSGFEVLIGPTGTTLAATNGRPRAAGLRKMRKRCPLLSVDHLKIVVTYDPRLLPSRAPRMPPIGCKAFLLRRSFALPDLDQAAKLRVVATSLPVWPECLEMRSREKMRSSQVQDRLEIDGLQ